MAKEIAIGPREINILEDALAWGALRKGFQRFHAVGTEDRDLARFHVADVIGFDQVQGAGFRSDHAGVSVLVVFESAENQRTKAIGVPRRNHPVKRQEQERISAPGAAQGFDDAAHQRCFS